MSISGSPTCISKPYFGSAPLREIAGTDLTRFVSEKLSADLTIGYVKRMVWIFRAIYDPCVDAVTLKRHPGKVKIHYRKTEVTGNALDEVEEDRRGGRALTVEEVHRLINNSRSIYQPMIALMVWTGLRIGEVLAMQWNYMDTQQ